MNDNIGYRIPEQNRYDIVMDVLDDANKVNEGNIWRFLLENNDKMLEHCLFARQFLKNIFSKIWERMEEYDRKAN